RQNFLFVLYTIVRRQAAFGLAERHTAPRHDEANADFRRRMDLIIDLAAILEDIGVVEDRRAAGACELCAADNHRGAGVFRSAGSPNPVMRLEPREEVRVLAGG